MLDPPNRDTVPCLTNGPRLYLRLMFGGGGTSVSQCMSAAQDMALFFNIICLILDRYMFIKHMQCSEIRRCRCIWGTVEVLYNYRGVRGMLPQGKFEI